MSRCELNHFIARATGETFESVAHRGFHLLDGVTDEDGPHVVDWEDETAARLVDLLSTAAGRDRMACLPSYDEELDSLEDENWL